MRRFKRTGASRPAMDRIVRIHQHLKTHSYPNSRSLAKEFEVVSRTVKRDIDFMKFRMDLPIDFDSRRNGYYYTEPVEELPQLPMSEAEMFALFVAQKAIEQYQGTPFQRPLENAFRTLTGQLDRQVKFYAGGVEGMISFRPFAPGDADLRTFDLLARAIRERRAITFQYRNHGTIKPQRRHVNPYHLACVENRWCLFAHDMERAAMRTFVLSRLTRPQLTRRHFSLSKRFDLNEYLRGSFSLFKGNEDDDYQVVIDFDSWAADEVRGRHWHSSQQVRELPRGMLRLEMRLNNLEEVEKWVLGFGTHATVVRPELLRKRLSTITGILAKAYREPVATA